jgi:serine/threonine protein phosphatase PrpC
MIIELHAKTDVGRVRKGNEDNFLALDLTSENSWTGSEETASSDAKAVEKPDTFARFTLGAKGAVFAISDGMGGALAGEVASRMTVDTVRERVLNSLSEGAENADSDTLIEALRAAADYANFAIHRRSQTDPDCSGMGATLTGAAVTAARDADGKTRAILGLVQVGDSRAYLIRGSEIRQATKDQSLVQQLVDAGQITQDEADHHMFRNVILQALGAQPELIPVVCRVELRRDDLLLMCSDGLSGKITADEMLQIVSSSKDNLSDACQKLIAAANERGGEDNITVILARFTGDDLPPADSAPIDVEFVFDEETSTLSDEPALQDLPTEIP